jgi:hypothetical protein
MVNRHQQHVIEYLIEENRVLKGQLKGRRLRLTDDQRRRLAAKGQRLGRPHCRVTLADSARDRFVARTAGSERWKLRWNRHD